MPKELGKIFSSYRSPEPSEELFNKITLRLKWEQAKRAKFRLAVFSLTFVASLAAVVPALRLIWQDASQSGFADFVSLFFSDPDLALAYWQNFVLALLEVLPVLSLALFVAVLAVFMESLKLLVKNFKGAYPRLV
ncbi:MAG: hypothetical protein WC668_01795 [Patescibacteria group bacterium]|jgi:ABC-type phosphate/phosphonate transport system permease subunit